MGGSTDYWVSPKRRGLSRRRLLSTAAFGSAGLVLAACGGGSGGSGSSSGGGLGTVAAGTGATATAAPTTAAPTVKPGGTLRSARSTELQSFDSVENNNWVGGLALVLPIHDRLFEYDTKLRVVLSEGLVSSFERPDPLTYVLKLQQGVTFHDGTPFNARAVAYQFDRARNSPTSFAKGEMTAVAGAETPDDSTVVVKLALGAGDFPLTLAMGRIGGVASPAAVEKYGKDISRNPVGTGPFMFEAWEPGVKWSYVKYPNYWRKGLPYLDKVVYTLIADNQVQSTGLRSKEIDAISGPGALAKQFDTLKGGDLTIEEAPGLQIFVCYVNGGRPPFNNPALAQAFNYALNREELIQVATSGHGAVQSGFIPRSHPYFDPGFQPFPPKGDEQRAKQKLAEGGMPDGFTCTIDVTNADVFPSMAQAAQAQLAKVGIKANVRLNDSTGTSTRLLVSLDMDAILGTIPVQANLYNTAAQVYATTGGFNPKGQRVPNPQIDVLVKQAGAATTEEEAKKAYLELQKLVAEDGRNPVFGVANVISFTQKYVRDHPASADGATRLTRVWLSK